MAHRETRGHIHHLPVYDICGGGVYTATLTANYSVERFGPSVFRLAPSGADRTVYIDESDPTTKGRRYVFVNTGTNLYKLIVATATLTLYTVEAGHTVELMDDGSSWRVIRYSGQSQVWDMPFSDLWRVDGDGAETNGGGAVGDVTLTEAAAARAVIEDYDVGGSTYEILSLSSNDADYAANYQMWPDVGTIANSDAVYFGHTLPFPELAFDLATIATYGGAAITWEYYSTTTSDWAALTISYDGTDLNGHVGTRPFQQDGAIVFVPPTDWGTVAVNGVTAYWIRARVTTAANVTQIPVTNAKEHEIVTLADPFYARHKGTMRSLRFVDGAPEITVPMSVEVPILAGVAGGGAYTKAVASGLETVTRTAADAADDYWIPIPLPQGGNVAVVPTGLTVNYTVNGAQLEDVRFEVWKVTQGADGAARTAAVLFGDDNADYDAAHNTAIERGDNTGAPELHKATLVDAGTPVPLAANEALLLRVYVDGDAATIPAGVFVLTSAILQAEHRSVLHTTQNVVFFLWNYTSGEGTGELTIPQDRRTSAWNTDLEVDEMDELGVIVTQEDGADNLEIRNALLQAYVYVENP